MPIHPDYYHSDRSEHVDPRRAADELIVYAHWVKSHAERESGRRIPTEAAELLYTLSEKGQGLGEIYKDFEGWRPRRNWLDETKRKMVRELFLNESEMDDWMRQQTQSMSEVEGSYQPVAAPETDERHVHKL